MERSLSILVSRVIRSIDSTSFVPCDVWVRANIMLSLLRIMQYVLLVQRCHGRYKGENAEARQYQRVSLCRSVVIGRAVNKSEIISTTTNIVDSISPVQQQSWQDVFHLYAIKSETIEIPAEVYFANWVHTNWKIQPQTNLLECSLQLELKNVPSPILLEPRNLVTSVYLKFGGQLIKIKTN